MSLLTGANKLISILALRVEPEPHVIDQTFRFHQPEQSFLKKSIRLPPFQNMIGGLVDRMGYQQLLVKCSDENVICESYKRQSGEPQDVFIKVSRACDSLIRLICMRNLYAKLSMTMFLRKFN